jgi:hypothetical protein
MVGFFRLDRKLKRKVAIEGDHKKFKERTSGQRIS